MSDNQWWAGCFLRPGSVNFAFPFPQSNHLSVSLLMRSWCTISLFTGMFGSTQSLFSFSFFFTLDASADGHPDLIHFFYTLSLWNLASSSGSALFILVVASALCRRRPPSHSRRSAISPHFSLSPPSILSRLLSIIFTGEEAPRRVQRMRWRCVCQPQEGFLIRDCDCLTKKIIKVSQTTRQDLNLAARDDCRLRGSADRRPVGPPFPFLRHPSLPIVTPSLFSYWPESR